MTQNNTTIGRLFREMADLLAAQGANPYRVRAYRRAAETLADLTEDVATLHGRDELLNVPGIGRELAAKIDEFLNTGCIGAHRDLQIPLPAEVSDWVQLPGLSESLVHYLFSRLGIRSLDDLESLARSHFMRTLPGFDASEQELLTAIARMRTTLRQSSPTTSDGSP